MDYTQSTHYLVLEDGTVYKGTGFGAAAPNPGELEARASRSDAAGEVVFNTGMCGYHEILTDPSYTGQIVTMTYPHIGNYGDSDDWSENGPGEADRGGPVKAAGLVVRKLYTGPVPKGRQTLHDFLSGSGIPGIAGIDTRRLTLSIRDGGSPKGVIVRSETAELTENDLEACRAYLAGFPDMEGRNLIGIVGVDRRGGTGRRSTDADAENGKHRSLALIDCGLKANIVRELERRNCTVDLYPSDTSAEEILAGNHDAVMISNGPGDPAVLAGQIACIRELIGKVPVLGICLGHQLIALAMGAKTYKMKFGHHGVNHPVRDEFSKKVFVTSQNHGFSVEEKSLPAGLEVWFRNANDDTVEGLSHETLPVLCAQFHPESAPGPDDSHWIFDRFLERVDEAAADTNMRRS
ncbi:MAG: glutamine-hydrolyzing carbamoyl-phosphate synthase small subunit [Spirochaetia bacterium]